MSVCRQCPKCRGWGKLRSRTGVIIDCGSCLGSGCAKHKATPGLPVGANYDLTGVDEERDRREARYELGAPDSPAEGTEA